MVRKAKLSDIELLKINILANGLTITKKAEDSLTKSSKVPLSLFEYPTTSGVSIKLPGDVYVNAKFEGLFENPKIILDFKRGKYYIIAGHNQYVVEMFPLPSYFNKKNKSGELYTSFMMSHVDRLRLSPISGCSFRCKYCDLNLLPYNKKPLKKLIEAMNVAISDKNLPPRHMILSGGTPLPEDEKWQDYIYKNIIEHAKKKRLKIDVMLSPRREKNYLRKLKSWGADNVTVDLELYNKRYSKKYNPQKYAIGREFYLKFIKEAVELFGVGNVRSVLIVGLEPFKDTLKAVEALAKIGCDPVLGPFVPAPGTPLESHPIPKERDLVALYTKSLAIVKKYSVKLGPQCLPCQHNVLAVPTNG